LQNSSLVLTSDSRRSGDNEPTGEAMTLWGKIDPKQMGDRAKTAKPKDLEDKLGKAKKRSVAASPCVNCSNAPYAAFYAYCFLSSTLLQARRVTLPGVQTRHQAEGGRG
jgi:hypothetical protein